MGVVGGYASGTRNTGRNAVSFSQKRSQGKPMRLSSTILICLIFTLLTSPLSAKCLKSEITQVLDDYGYTYAELEENDGDYNFTLSKDGDRIRGWVEPDGDISLRKWYTNSRDYSNDDLAQVMRDLKYLAVYLDHDGDIEMAYDYPWWGSTCPSNFREIINLFLDLTEAAEKKLYQ